MSSGSARAVNLWNLVLHATYRSLLPLNRKLNRELCGSRLGPGQTEKKTNRQRYQQYHTQLAATTFDEILHLIAEVCTWCLHLIVPKTQNTTACFKNDPTPHMAVPAHTRVTTTTKKRASEHRRILCGVREKSATTYITTLETSVVGRYGRNGTIEAMAWRTGGWL